MTARPPWPGRRPPGRTASTRLSITASNGVTPDATQTFTLTVDAAPAITSADSTTLHRGTGRHLHGDHHRLPDAGHLGDRLPCRAGSPSPTTGTGRPPWPGTPAAGTSGAYSLTITAPNGISPDASQSFTLTVDPAPAITSADSTTFVEGQAGTFTVTLDRLPDRPRCPKRAPCRAESPSVTTVTARPPWPGRRRRARPGATRSPSRPATE